MQREREFAGAGDTVIRIEVLKPHAALGPEAEFPEMAPGRA
jgi:hypothetical protein